MYTNTVFYVLTVWDAQSTHKNIMCRALAVSEAET